MATLSVWQDPATMLHQLPLDIYTYLVRPYITVMHTTKVAPIVVFADTNSPSMFIYGHKVYICSLHCCMFSSVVNHIVNSFPYRTPEDIIPTPILDADTCRDVNDEVVPRPMFIKGQVLADLVTYNYKSKMLVPSTDVTNIEHVFILYSGVYFMLEDATLVGIDIDALHAAADINTLPVAVIKRTTTSNDRPIDVYLQDDTYMVVWYIKRLNVVYYYNKECTHMIKSVFLGMCEGQIVNIYAFRDVYILVASIIKSVSGTCRIRWTVFYNKQQYMVREIPGYNDTDAVCCYIDQYGLAHMYEKDEYTVWNFWAWQPQKLRVRIAMK